MLFAIGISLIWGKKSPLSRSSMSYHNSTVLNTLQRPANFFNNFFRSLKVFAIKIGNVQYLSLSKTFWRWGPSWWYSAKYLPYKSPWFEVHLRGIVGPFLRQKWVRSHNSAVLKTSHRTEDFSFKLCEVLVSGVSLIRSSCRSRNHRKENTFSKFSCPLIFSVTVECFDNFFELCEVFVIVIRVIWCSLIRNLYSSKKR